MKTRFGALFTFLFIAANCLVIACTHSSKMGLDVNNANAVGTQLGEMPIVGYTIPADTVTKVSDDGGTTFTAWTASAPTLAISETVIGGIGPGPFQIPIAGCYIEPQAALTASNTNYATLDIYKRAGDAGAAVLLASASTVITQSDAGSDAAATGNWVAYSNMPLTVVTGAYVSPYDMITFVDSKTGAGVALPQAKLHCYTTIQ
jgi:hypothetical protein